MLRIGAQTRRLLCIIVLVIGVSAVAPVAAAEDRSAVVVIDSGTEDLFIESLVRTNAETELKNQGYQIALGAKVGGDTPAKLLACAGDLPCSITAMQGIPAKSVIFISLRSDSASDSTNFKIVVRDYDVATGKVLARTMRRCPECKEEVDLAGFTAQLIIELVRESEALIHPPEDPTPTPPTDPVETTPAEQPIVPVTGAIPVPQQVGNGNLGLEREGTGSAMSVLKYVGLGVGTVAIATGTYLVLIDGPVIEDSVRQPEANDTLVSGFVTLGVGVAAVGLSAWLWASEADDDTAASRAQIVPTRGGAAFVWSGGF
jgi:hypothetical protein